jgi:hypothetical protein
MLGACRHAAALRGRLAAARWLYALPPDCSAIAHLRSAARSKSYEVEEAAAEDCRGQSEHAAEGPRAALPGRSASMVLPVEILRSGGSGRPPNPSSARFKARPEPAGIEDDGRTKVTAKAPLTVTFVTLGKGRRHAPLTSGRVGPSGVMVRFQALLSHQGRGRAAKARRHCPNSRRVSFLRR